MSIKPTHEELEGRVKKLDREVVNGTTLDEDDMKRLKIHDDFDEIIMDSIDYEDEEVSYLITGTFEQDNDKFDYEVRVDMEEMEFDDMDILNVTKR